MSSNIMNEHYCGIKLHYFLEMVQFNAHFIDDMLFLSEQGNYPSCKHSHIQSGRHCVAETIALCGVHVLLAQRKAKKYKLSEGKHRNTKYFAKSTNTHHAHTLGTMCRLHEQGCNKLNTERDTLHIYDKYHRLSQAPSNFHKLE
jgi:hypothetical protein